MGSPPPTRYHLVGQLTTAILAFFLRNNPCCFAIKRYGCPEEEGGKGMWSDDNDNGAEDGEDGDGNSHDEDGDGNGDDVV